MDDHPSPGDFTTLPMFARLQAGDRPGAAFVDLVDREPSVRRRVLATLAATLRARTQQLTDIATLDVAGRLARWLLDRAIVEWVDGRPMRTARLPAPQSDLAAALGTTRVTINRALRDLHAAGLIALRPGFVLLLAPDGLVAGFEPPTRGGARS